MTRRISIIGSSQAALVVPGWNDYELMQFERAFMEEGVIDGVGNAFQVTQHGSGANMSIDVHPGRAIIEITNTNLAHGKTYKVHFDSDAIENVPITTADTTFARIDRVVLRVDVSTDPDGSAANIAKIEVLAGTPSVTPVAPVEPANTLSLALVSVPASDNQITNDQITDLRPYAELKDSVLRKILRQGFLNSFATVSGTGDAIALSMDPKISSYTDKFTIFFKATHTNTGATTVAIDSLPAKPIKKHENISLAANDIKAGMGFCLMYDADDDVFKLITVPGNSPDGQEIGSMKFWPSKVAPANWLLCAGQALSRSTYSLLFSVLVPNLGNFTVTIASPAVFTLTSHGLTEGDPVYFTTTGALPTGLSTNTIYYVIAAGLTADTFRVSATRGGSAINTSGSQSGTHTVFHCPYGLGDGSTTFTLPDTRGRAILPPDNMGGTAAGRLANAQGKGMGGAAGEETHQLTQGEMPSHSHTLSCYKSDYNGALTGAGSGYYSTFTVNTGGAGSDQAHNNMPPYLTIPMIIKYA